MLAYSTRPAECGLACHGDIISLLDLAGLQLGVGHDDLAHRDDEAH